MALGIPSNSPAVNFREIDLTGSVPNIPASVGAIAGDFSWGPVHEPVLVQNESGLVAQFGAPTTSNTVDFYSASYFLKYAEGLYVVRGIDEDSNGSTASNSYSLSTADDGPLVKNKTHFDQQADTLDNFSGDSDGDAVRGHELIARYPGVLGDALKVSICPVSSTDSAFDNWAYEGSFDAAPGTSSYADSRDGVSDEVHVVVVDNTGAITGTAGTVLEKYAYLSVASDAKTPEGQSNYVKTVLNERSNYVYMSTFGSPLSFDSDEWGLAANVGTATTPGTSKTFISGLSVKDFTFTGGANSGTLTTGDIATAYDEISDAETISVDIIIAPSMSSSTDQDTVVDNLVTIAGSTRKDAIVVASPARTDVVNIASATAVTNMVTTANRHTNSSYLALAGNFLKVYDKYHDQYVWIPAASSVAGLMAATDEAVGPWYSPAGTRRGNLLAVTDLAVNPTKAQRDTLYKAGINPIVTLTGQGTILYGDKTKLNRPSAFDRINVRRLFLKIEKDIANYSKNILFEFNDEFTRSEFVGVVEPYLRDIQSRRGITDFRVVCDETNNPASVIDNNEFIASIFVKPARSINYITLNFVAVRTGVSFEEVVGQV